MNIPRVKPPKKRARAQTRLTPMQEVELWSWFKAKKFLGTYKTKAQEMDIPVNTLISTVERMRRRELRGLERTT